MKKINDRKPELLLIACAAIIITAVLVMGHFDSPEYNVNVETGTRAVSYSASVISTETTTEAPHIIDGKINLNTATLEELTELYQIGEVRAQGIIDYREKNGGFESVEELTNISGITESVLEKNLDKITVG